MKISVSVKILIAACYCGSGAMISLLIWSHFPSADSGLKGYFQRGMTGPGGRSGVWLKVGYGTTPCGQTNMREILTFLQPRLRAVKWCFKRVSKEVAM